MTGSLIRLMIIKMEKRSREKLPGQSSHRSFLRDGGDANDGNEVEDEGDNNEDGILEQYTKKNWDATFVRLNCQMFFSPPNGNCNPAMI